MGCIIGAVGLVFRMCCCNFCFVFSAVIFGVWCCAAVLLLQHIFCRLLLCYIWSFLCLLLYFLPFVFVLLLFSYFGLFTTFALFFSCCCTFAVLFWLFISVLGAFWCLLLFLKFFFFYFGVYGSIAFFCETVSECMVVMRLLLVWFICAINRFRVGCVRL